jgi:molecular chaperone GrpE
LEQQDTQTEQDAKAEAADSASGADTGKPGEGGQAEASASKELAALNDKYVRLFAEFENFRRRTAKENFELVAAANQKLIAKLTDVLDNFELAFDPKHKTAKPEDFEKGVKLIQSKFKDILSDEGLEEINPAGEEFDPNFHDALMQQPSDTVPENRVSQVLQKGYKIKGRILKHAKVIVSKGPN